MKISTLLVAALLLGSANTALAQEAAQGDLKFENVIQSGYSQWHTPIVVASDGGVMVTGVQILNNSVGSFVAKGTRDLQADPVWKINITGGRSVVNTIVPDNAGGAYIGGNFNDQISIGDKTLSGKNSSSYTKTNGFVAHINSAGTVTAAYAFVVTANSDMVNNFPEAYSQGDKVYCSLNSIAVVNGKPYAGIIFTDVLGNADGSETLTSGTWDLMNYGMGVGSDADFAVVELDPTTLEAVSFPVVFGGTGTRTDSSYMGFNVESAKMTSDGEKLYLAATVGGFYSTASLAMDGEIKDSPSFKYAGGLNGVYVASIDLTNKTCVGKAYDGEYAWSASTSSMVSPEVATIDVKDDALYVGGSFYQNFPFDKTVAAVGNTDIYLATLNKDDLEVKSAIVSGYDEKTAADDNDEKFSGYVVDGEAAMLYGAVVGHTDYYSDAKTTSPLAFFVTDYAASTGVSQGTDTKFTEFVTGAVQKGQCIYAAMLNADQTNIYYQYEGDPTTGISTISADKANNDAIYNLQGMKLKSAQKGLNIIGGKTVVVK